MNKHVKWYTAWTTYDCGCTKAANAFYGMVDEYGEETDLYRSEVGGDVLWAGKMCWECSVKAGAENVRLA